ncbi:MAG: hypothetical protein LKI53_02880 [Bacteroidales bacterium]|jgi:DNA polymerase-3 subunit delta'|nr:hypothetical protein [Bacteroidales bacterium]
MKFSDIIGHKDIAAGLRKMVDEGTLPHAVLFMEKYGNGALPLALATIQYVFCRNRKDGDSCGSCHSCHTVSRLAHPDLHFAFPVNTSSIINGSSGKTDVDEFYPLWRTLVSENPYFSEQEFYNALGIENKLGIINVNQANGIMRKLSLKSYEGGEKIMLIMFPERMNAEAANKLLKSIEEPVPGTFYFMITHAPDKMLTTILSRCRKIEIPPVEINILAEELMKRRGIDKSSAAFWAGCSGGSYGKAVALMKADKNGSEYFDIFLRLMSAGIKKDLGSMFPIWNEIAGMGKQLQKDFCSESLDLIRKSYMISLGMENIAYISEYQREKLKHLSGLLKKNFYINGYSDFNDAIKYIERNVNPKFIFCDLCNRLYYNC